LDKKINIGIIALFYDCGVDVFPLVGHSFGSSYWSDT
jgi:hypothetical protein